MNIDLLIRENIKKMKPYPAARHEFSGAAEILLDANENSLGSILNKKKLNRYPDPLQEKLKKALSGLYKVKPENLFLGNGSDEAIDLILRISCEPGKDGILTMPPTYGMYEICAEINNVRVVQIPLNRNFQPDTEKIAASTGHHIKVIFICSPNNPSGNLIAKSEIERILEFFNGLVVIDEAYGDFSTEESWITRLEKYPNLIVLKTFSKAWGLAGIRLGMAFAEKQIISYLNKIKYPYNINTLTAHAALKALRYKKELKKKINVLISERKKLSQKLSELPCVEKVFPSDANFLLVQFKDARRTYEFLKSKGIIVRDRSREIHCTNCLRITVGSPEENETLMKQLKKLK
ncbi:MAG: histidinol-phosphate transaminase [Chitinophagaceae bacterium]|nr:histidinol-phosphate transaminase [Chitinophagaceae bacterium]